MDSPDKIYLQRNRPTYTSLNTTNDCRDKWLQEWFEDRRYDSDAEYVRADVFFKEFCEWAKRGCTFTDNDGNEHFNENMHSLIIEDFKSYMEGV